MKSLAPLLMALAAFSLEAQQPESVGVVLHASAGKWFLVNDITPLRGGQPLPAGGIVYSDATDRPEISIKVYGNPKPERHTAPSRFTLPASATDEPGVFEQFLRLYHRFVDPPTIELKTTLAWDPAKSFDDVLINVESAKKQRSAPAASPDVKGIYIDQSGENGKSDFGDIYVVKRYQPSETMAMFHSDEPSLKGLTAPGGVWMSANSQVKLQAEKASKVGANWTKLYDQELQSLSQLIGKMAVLKDAVLVLDKGQVDFSSVIGNLPPKWPVRVRSMPAESGTSGSNLAMLLSWDAIGTSAAPRYVAPLVPGVYQVSYFDMDLRKEIGTTARLLVVSGESKQIVDLQLSDFDRHMAEWGDLVDASTKRDLKRGFFRYLAETHRN